MRKLLLSLLIAGCAPRVDLRVAAAASLQDALREIAADYQRVTGQRVEFAFGASNILSRQIRAGAPVDVFFSADEKTMDGISDLIVPETRKALLSNQLVVVSREPLHDVHDLLTARRVALGDPNAVPAGVYAREYFQRIGVWGRLQANVIPMENVRAALAAADGGNVDAAVVYRTDALLAQRARIVFIISGAAAPEIRYPVAVLRHASHPSAARRFVSYLQSAEASAIFTKFGFVTTPPPRPASARSADRTSTRPARSRS